MASGAERCEKSVMSTSGCRRCSRMNGHPDDCDYNVAGPWDRPWEAEALAAARKEIERLKEALRGTMKWMKDTADSGDAGFFNAEEITEYQVAAEALAEGSER